MNQTLTAEIDGGIPLVGEVKPSGSRTLALKLIYASILSGEECVIENVPKCKFVLDDIELAQELGVNFSWSQNRLLINSLGLKSYELFQKGIRKVSTLPLIVPALIHKFGKAVILKTARSDEYAKIWQSFGMEVKEDEENQYIEAIKLQSAEVTLPYKSRMLTEMAILSALFILGESLVLNASTDIEVDDLIDFCQKTGVDIARKEDGSIYIKGAEVFRGQNFILPYDREEAAFFIVATLLTNGNSTILGFERLRMLPFVNWLSKIGANYEFADGNMRVWHNSGTPFLPTEIAVSPHPGFMTDFVPFATLLASFAQGETKITEHVLTRNMEFFKELNKFGADVSLQRVEDFLEVSVEGPAKLTPGKISVGDLRDALPFLLYGLVVEGKNILTNYHIIESGFEDITKKLTSLGASLSFSLNR